jgi:hypothetical protein
MFKVLLPVILLFPSDQLTGQVTISEALANCRTISDSIITSYVGQDYFERHFVHDPLLPVVWNHSQGTYTSPRGFESLLMDTVNCGCRYILKISEKYKSDIVYVDTRFDGHVELNTGLMKFLAARTRLAFVSDSIIENVALQQLGLAPGQFHFQIAYDGSIGPTDCKDGRIVTRPVPGHLADRLLIRISEPDTYKRKTIYEEKVTFGKFIIIDAYTGEIIEKGRRRSCRLFHPIE